jgi:Amt family ammonium transporter
MAIGAVASAVCYLAVVLVKGKLGYDDSLDAFGVHGVGGIVGALLTGFFATKAINPAGFDGLFYGNPMLALKQLTAVAVCAAFSFIVSWVLLKVIDKTMGLRVAEDSESIGLDLTQHRESAYTVVG